MTIQSNAKDPNFVIKNRERRNGSADILRLSYSGNDQRFVKRKGRNSYHRSLQTKQRSIQYRKNMIVIDGNLYFNTALRSNLLLTNEIKGHYIPIYTFKSYLLIYGFIKANVDYMLDEIIWQIIKYYGYHSNEQNEIIKSLNSNIHNICPNKPLTQQIVTKKHEQMLNNINRPKKEPTPNVSQDIKKCEKIRSLIVGKKQELKQEKIKIKLAQRNAFKEKNSKLTVKSMKITSHNNMENMTKETQIETVKNESTNLKNISQKNKNEPDTKTSAKIVSFIVVENQNCEQKKPKQEQIKLEKHNAFKEKNNKLTKSKKIQLNNNTRNSMENMTKQTQIKPWKKHQKIKHKENILNISPENKNCEQNSYKQQELLDEKNKKLKKIKSLLNNNNSNKTKDMQHITRKTQIKITNKNGKIKHSKTKTIIKMNKQNKRRNSNPITEQKQNKNSQQIMNDIIDEIEFDNEDAEEKKSFDDKRKVEFDTLLDGFFSESESHQSVKSHKYNTMTLQELLTKFNIPTNSDLYKYYHQTLNIEYANDFLNYSPAIITQPKQFKSTKIRIILAKFSKFVIKKIKSGTWDGIKAKEWLKLETNKFYYVFGETVVPTHSNANDMCNITLDDIKSSDICFEDTQSNKMVINDNGILFVNKKININSNKTNSRIGIRKCKFNITVEQLPDMDNEQYYSMIVGLAFYDKNNTKYDTVYMCNRCAIYRNDNYITMLSLSNHLIIENQSEIIISIENSKEDSKAIMVGFQHLRNGKICKYNEKKINMNPKPFGFVKIFVEQFCGQGIYCVYEILSNTEETDIDIGLKQKKKKKKKPKKKKHKKKKLKIETEKSMITKKQLLQLSKPKLVKKCKKYKVSTIGSKADMAERILSEINHRTHAKQIKTVSK